MSIGPRAVLVIPSLYPYSLAPLAASVASALWANFLWVALLALALYLLCGSLKIKCPLLVVLAVLTSPLLVGLSRTLYCELMLTATVTLAYAVWLRSGPFTTRRSFAFSAALSLAFLSKPTAVLFLAGPIALESIRLLHARQTSELRRLAIGVALAAAAALLVQTTLLRSSLQYYFHWAWTDTGAMALIGPGDLSSPAAWFYYARELLRSGLGWIALIAPVAIWGLLTQKRRATTDLAPVHIAILCLWLAVPIVALTFVPMKEPRHLLPCVVPAILLIVYGISAMPPLWRRVSWYAIFAVALARIFPDHPSRLAGA